MTSIFPNDYLTAFGSKKLGQVSVAMILEPPGQFSTTIGCPRISCNGVYSMRAMMSLVPPGGLGRMKRIGLLGQDSASAGMLKIAIALARATASATAFRFIILLPFCILLFRASRRWARAAVYLTMRKRKLACNRGC